MTLLITQSSPKQMLKGSSPKSVSAVKIPPGTKILTRGLEDEVVSTFREELDRFYKMSGVFVQMLLHDAEKQDANINAEVSFMENYKALEEIKQFEEEKEALTLPSMVNKVSKMASKLPTLLDKDENKQLQLQNKQLMTENESLKKKIAFQEKKLIDSLKEK